MVGLLFGVALAFLRDYFDDVIGTKEDLDSSSYGLPMIGVVPVTPSAHSTERPSVVAVSAPSSPAAEAYRSLGSVILLSCLDNPPKVLVVTSAMAGEGKSTVSCNLAAALAQRGRKVLLVDADLRRRSCGSPGQKG